MSRHVMSERFDSTLRAALSSLMAAFKPLLHYEALKVQRYRQVLL